MIHVGADAAYRLPVDTLMAERQVPRLVGYHNCKLLLARPQLAGSPAGWPLNYLSNN